MSRCVVIIVIIVLVGSGSALALTGSGTEGDPWLIQSLDDFNDFAADANYWDDYTRLETDVNLAGMVYERAVIAPDVDDSKYAFQGTAFTGVFDGNSHTISNFTYTSTGTDYIGLFGCIDDPNVEVKNLGLVDSSVDAGTGWCVGSLVGSLGSLGYYGTITNCYVEGGSVSGDFLVGGLVGGGYNLYGTISNCYSTASVSGVRYVGGLVGENWGDLITDCYATGTVEGGQWVGGLFGGSFGIISNSYATGSVSGSYPVGGLVGQNGYSPIDGTIYPGDIYNSYSTGRVQGNSHVGGLVGYQGNGEVLSSFWDIQTSGMDTSAGGTGLPTDRMQDAKTFIDAGWDFINVWNIGENQTYPYLRAYLAGDINHDGIVNFFDFAIIAGKWLEMKGNY